MGLSVDLDSLHRPTSLKRYEMQNNKYRILNTKYEKVKNLNGMGLISGSRLSRPTHFSSALPKMATLSSAPFHLHHRIFHTIFLQQILNTKHKLLIKKYKILDTKHKILIKKPLTRSHYSSLTKSNTKHKIQNSKIKKVW